MSRTNLLRIAAAVLVTAGFAVLAWRYLSAQTLAASFSQLTFGPLAAALGTYVVVTGIRALRFQIAGAKLTFGQAFRIAAVHSAVLRVMPMRSGELAYVVLLKRTGKGGYGEGAATLVMLRILDLTLIFAFAVAVFAGWYSGTGSESAVVTVLVAALLFGLVFFASGPASRAVNRRIDRLSEDSRRRLAVRIVRTLAETHDISLGQRLVLVGLTLALWVLVLSWFYAILSGMGLGLAPIEGAVVGVLGIVGSILPVSLLGTFGPLEGGFAAGLAAIGQQPEAAAAQSVLLSTVTFANNWIVALPAWIWMALSRSERVSNDPR